MGHTRVELLVQTPHATRRLHGQGNGPLDAAWHAVQSLGLPEGAMWHGFEEHATGQGSDATALAWVEVGAPGVAPSVYGAGRHPHLVSASIQAMMQAINRLMVKAGWCAQDDAAVVAVAAEAPPGREEAA